MKIIERQLMELRPIRALRLNRRGSRLNTSLE